MKLRTLFLVTASLSALATISCSGSAPPPAQGSMSIHVASSSSPPAGTKCNIPGHNATIGDPPPGASSAGARVKDGDGATVHCSVKGSGTYSVSGAMRKGSVSFQLNGKVPSKGDGTASVSSFDPTSDTTMRSPQDKPCTISPIEIAGGRIWAHFDCPGFVNPSAPSTYCQADGFFVFENCDQ